MEFEEVLSALREGKAIKRTKEIWRHHFGCFQLIDNRLYDLYENWVEEIDVEDLLADDWEIVKETKKVKLRDLTKEQLEKWRQTNCSSGACKNCVFNSNTDCIYLAYYWIKNKPVFTDKFLDQEIEIEEE